MEATVSHMQTHGQIKERGAKGDGGGGAFRKAID